MSRKKSENIFLSMRPVHRTVISLLFAAMTFLITRKSNLNAMIVGMIMWDAFALSYVILSWIVFFKSSVTHIATLAQKDDGSRIFVFIVVVIASFASMLTVLLLVISKENAGASTIIYLPVIIAGILLSWILVHTTFCFHYAHLFYNVDDVIKPTKGGLEFPKEQHPDYLDFAYFSFVVGMTFQVSDVEISSRIIRRVALVHGLISFLLNTFVVALTINLIAGLKN
ncbi:MAG: hypothetical protein JWR61_2039 [Ferruginibacter sp.]|uniref:DUF1345 domain-containing protein n=1 Tax=Ferruginibacter sp. TaxID=1940288 RepID=UPI00265B58A4|nr:DUF1345 domain-containing protein [Ferruginibacter sp.]MDB5277084.1 hypothetical protein [Ferruginibacter sp.]